MLRRLLQDYIHHVSGIWRKNRPGFFRRHRAFLVLAALASAADCLTTIYFLIYNPELTESHPVVRYLCHALGPIAGPILGKLGQFAFLIVLAVYLRRWAFYLLGTAAFLYFYAAWYNIWGYELYTPLFLRMIEPLIRF